MPEVVHTKSGLSSRVDWRSVCISPVQMKCDLMYILSLDNQKRTARYSNRGMHLNLHCGKIDSLVRIAYCRVESLSAFCRWMNTRGHRWCCLHRRSCCHHLHWNQSSCRLHSWYDMKNLVQRNECQRNDQVDNGLLRKASCRVACSVASNWSSSITLCLILLAYVWCLHSEWVWAWNQSLAEPRCLDDLPWVYSL